MPVILMMCLVLVACFSCAEPLSASLGVSSGVSSDVSLVASSVVSGSDPAIVLWLSHLLGDTMTIVMLTIAVSGFIWSQLRQIIPAETLAKLPHWLLWLLELLAANKGRAANAINNRPEHYKKWGGS